jgi:hypothetical protein
MSRNRDYSWFLPVLAWVLLTILIVWLFSMILPSIRVEDKGFNELLSQLKNFGDLMIWFFLGVFFSLLSGLVIGLSIISWRFCLRKKRPKKNKSQELSNNLNDQNSGSP